MSAFVKFLKNTHWFWFFIPFIAVALFMMGQSAALSNCVAPYGILSFEFARTAECAQSMMDSWGANVGKARTNIWIDFLYIPLYVLFLSALVVKAPYYLKEEEGKDSYAMNSLLMVCFLLVAGIMDMLENYNLLAVLNGQELTQHANNAFWYAAVKFLCLLIPLGFLFRILITRNYFSLVVLWYCRFSVLNILLLFFLLWGVEQGQDLLIGINESGSHVIFTIIFLTIIAMFNWYLPRFYFPDPDKENRNYSFWETLFKTDKWATKLREREVYYRDVPRLLGLLTILIFMGAIINVLQRFYLFNFGTAYLWVAVIMLLAWISLIPKNHNWIKSRMKEQHYRWILGFLLSLLAFMLAFKLVDDRYFKNGPIGLYLLSLALLFLAVAFFMFICFRKSFSKKIEMLRTRNFDDRSFMWVILLGYGLSVGLFIGANFSSQLADLMGTIAVTLSAITTYLGTIALLSIRVRRRPYNYVATGLILLIILAISTSANDNDYHDVKVLSLEERASLKKRVSLDQYFDQWVQNNAALQSDTTDSPFPVFIMATNGGGSIAGYWTGLIQASLDDTMNHRFTQDHLFAVSGVSGGSVGNAMSIAIQQSRKEGLVSDSTNLSLINEIYRHDFLSASIATVLGKDIFQGIIPFKFQTVNSARKVEQAWARGVKWVCGSDLLNRPFESFWYQDNGQVQPGIPLYFANSMRVETGQRAISSPVAIDTAIFADAVDILDFGQRPLTIPLNTAALLSARFPYMNPAGKIDYAENNSGHFVDGGYFDNSGTITALEILKHLRRHRNQKIATDSVRNKAYAKLDFRIIKVDHDKSVYRDYLLGSEEGFGLYTECGTREVAEWGVPPAGGINSILVGRVRHVNKLLRNAVPPSKYHHFILPFTIKERDCLKYCEEDNCDFYRDPKSKIIPLGRYLSRKSLEDIREGLDYKHNKELIDEIYGLCN